MCNFNPSIQQFKPTFKYANTDVDIICEQHKLWFLCRKPQKAYNHLYKWTAVPALINPFGFFGIELSFTISFIMFLIYIKTVFKIMKFYNIWNSIHVDYINFEIESEAISSKLLREIYLDKSGLLPYFTRAIVNLKYFHGKIKKL